MSNKQLFTIALVIAAGMILLSLAACMALPLPSGLERVGLLQQKVSLTSNSALVILALFFASGACAGLSFQMPTKGLKWIILGASIALIWLAEGVCYSHIHKSLHQINDALVYLAVMLWVGGVTLSKVMRVALE